jgi:hypothetical protein
MFTRLTGGSRGNVEHGLHKTTPLKNTALILLPGILLTTLFSVHLKVFEVLVTPILVKSLGAIYLMIVLAVIIIGNWGFSFH